jgi:hypothetical protein
LIGFIQFSSKYLLVLEKGLLQKNQRSAENGDGCAEHITKCLLSSIKLLFCCAKAPRKINTKCSFLSDKILITASVKICQPISLCEFGVSFLTVNVAFKRNTHSCVHFVKLPDFGAINHKSEYISLYIFLSDGGIVTPS